MRDETGAHVRAYFRLKDGSEVVVEEYASHERILELCELIDHPCTYTQELLGAITARSNR
jgi:hypothetical protein